MDKSDQPSDQQKNDDHRQGNNADDSPSSTSDTKDLGTGNGNNSLKNRFFNLFTDFYCPRRYVVVLLLFAGMCIVHAQRVNVGVAVVSIIDSRHRTKQIASDTIAKAIITDSVRLFTC